MTNEHRRHKQFRGSPEFLSSPQRLALLEVQRVIKLSLEGVSVRTVLDVGAGSGVFTQAFAAEGLPVTGLDLSMRMLTYARKQAPAIPFVLARMETLPFPKDAFDLLFLGHALHETNDLNNTLAELYRCARVRAAALEWPYVDEEAGPPLWHRLQPDQVAFAAQRAGFTGIEAISLQRMILYRLTK